jgi:hypothetical protein
MPRIGIKLLLFLFALAALWLSTFAGYPGANDVRKGVLLIVFMSAGYCAVLFRGRRRAFWAGFFIVMLLHAPNLGASFDSSAHWHWFGYVANFDVDELTNKLIVYFADRTSTHFGPYYSAIAAPLDAAWLLTLAAIIGAVGAYIYERSRAEM